MRPDLQDFFTSLGLSLGTGLELAFVVGLLVAIALVGALWWLGIEGMPRRGPAASTARSSAAASRTR